MQTKKSATTSPITATPAAPVRSETTKKKPPQVLTEKPPHSRARFHLAPAVTEVPQMGTPHGQWLLAGHAARGMAAGSRNLAGQGLLVVASWQGKGC